MKCKQFECGPCCFQFWNRWASSENQTLPQTGSTSCASFILGFGIEARLMAVSVNNYIQTGC